MTDIGSIGLPKRRVDHLIGYRNTGFEARLFQEYHKLIYEHDTAKIKLNDLKNDSRTLIPDFDRKHYTETRAMWWLWRANETSIQQADTELENYLNSDRIEKTIALWIYGIDPSKSITITEDIKIVPPDEIPESDDKEFLLDQRPKHPISESVKPSAVLVANYFEPKHWTTQDNSQRFAENLAKFKAINDAALLLNCMPGACSIPGYQTGYYIASVPPGPFSGIGGGKSQRDIVSMRPTSLSSVDANVFDELLKGYRRLNGTWRARIIRALQRLSQSKARQDLDDKFLDLGIALEMILLNSTHSGDLPGQLHNHFRMRGAWLLGRDLKHRRAIFSDLGKIYTLRSQVAHSGLATGLDKMASEDLKTKTSLYVDLAEQIFRKIIIDGPPDDWSNLVLGGN